MDRNRYDTSRKRLLLIGASASVLALIALSGCCWVASIWAEFTSEEEIGFWQILGVSSAGFVAILLLQPVSRRLCERQSGRAQAEKSRGHTDSTATAPSPSTPLHTAAATPCVSRPRWREMYEQLSHEDQELFKKMMKRVCNGTPDVEDEIEESRSE